MAINTVFFDKKPTGYRCICQIPLDYR